MLHSKEAKAPLVLYVTKAGRRAAYVWHLATTKACPLYLQAYADYITMLELTEELVRAAAQAATGGQQVRRCHWSCRRCGLPLVVSSSSWMQACAGTKRGSLHLGRGNVEMRPAVSDACQRRCQPHSSQQGHQEVLQLPHWYMLPCQVVYQGLELDFAQPFRRATMRDLVRCSLLPLDQIWLSVGGCDACSFDWPRDHAI
jgi:hypothetical protein